MSSALRSRSPQPSWQRAAPYGSIGCCRRRAAITQDDHVTRRPRSAVALPCRTGGGPRRQAALSAAAGASRSRETSTPRVVRAQQSLSPDSDALAKGRATRTLRPRPPTGIGPTPRTGAPPRPPPIPAAAATDPADSVDRQNAGRDKPPPHPPRPVMRSSPRADPGPGGSLPVFPRLRAGCARGWTVRRRGGHLLIHTLVTRALFGAGLFPPMPPGEPPSLLSLWPSAQAYAMQPAKSTS
jgi:hypothetical protein